METAYKHIDGPMKAMWNTTMQELFGGYAQEVSVHNIIFMQSGVGDFDVPKLDYKILKNSTHSVHSPLELL